MDALEASVGRISAEVTCLLRNVQTRTEEIVGLTLAHSSAAASAVGREEAYGDALKATERLRELMRAASTLKEELHALDELRASTLANTSHTIATQTHNTQEFSPSHLSPSPFFFCSETIKQCLTELETSVRNLQRRT